MSKNLPTLLFALLMLIVAVAVISIGKLTPGDLMQWSLAFFLLALETLFIFLIWFGTRRSAPGDSGRVGINLEKLISEQDGVASFSRFQFLIFTFIVASAYIVQVFAALNGKSPITTLPTIPESVLGLIGISGGSYLVSKGIEKSGETTATTPPPGVSDTLLKP